MMGLSRIKSCKAMSRRIVVIVCPSVFLLLYLMMTDEGGGRPAAVASLSSAEDMSTFNDIIYNRPPVIYNFSVTDLDKRFNFSTAGEGDVMVFLHMQKTGGTFFGKNLVKNLWLDNPCICTKGESMMKCPCVGKESQRYWLFSRYSTGWKCGLHADYTELSECLAAGKLDELEESPSEIKRRYYYVSVLRDPSERYVSEWMHVSRGASWISSTLRCNGRSPSLSDAPFCFRGASWDNVTLDEFMNCPTNLARNRQTRMLANLTKIGCYSSDMMDNPIKRRLLLESAKQTLRSLAYFSIMPYMNESQYLFERTINLKFKTPFFRQKNRHNRNSGDVLYNLSDQTRQKIRQVNDLDMELYSYAKQLFFQRYNYAKRKDINIKPTYLLP